MRQSPASLSQRASGKDRLPSAVSLVQHVCTSDGWNLRLCSIDVDRGSGERVQQRQLRGHRVQNDVLSMLPHPRNGLVATLDSGGELLIWECGFQLQNNADPPIPPAEGGIPEAAPAHGVDSRMMHKLLQLPGVHTAVAWLHTCGAAVVTAGATGLGVFLRTGPPQNRRWKQGPSLTMVGTPATWLALHAFARNPDPGDAWPSQQAGFVLRSDGWLGVWRAAASAQGEPPETLELLGSAELGECACAAPLARASASCKAGTIGELVACGLDGSVHLWEATHTVPGGLCLVAKRCVNPDELSGSSLSPLKIHASGGSVPRLAIIEKAAEQQQLLVLEFESRGRWPSIEAVLELDTASPSDAGASPCCAWLDLGCCLQLLAVSRGNEVHLHLQRPTSEFLGQRAPWSLLRKLPMPTGVLCSSLAWIDGGSLLLAAGSQLLVWPGVAHTLFSASGRVAETGENPYLGPLGPWHPAQLTQELLADETDRGEGQLRRLLQHLKQQPGQAPPWLRLEEVLCGAAGGSAVKAASIPTAASGAPETDTAATNDLDFFAPSETAAFAADLFAPSPSALPNFLDLPAEPSAVRGTDLQSTATGLQALVDELVSLLEARLQRSETTPGLGMSGVDEAQLLALLRAQRSVAAAAAGLDRCGGRFLLRALTVLRFAAETTRPVASVDVAWAVLSQCQSTVLDTYVEGAGGPRDWKALRAVGAGFWLPQVCATCRALVPRSPQPSVPTLLQPPHARERPRTAGRLHGFRRAMHCVLPWTRRPRCSLHSARTPRTAPCSSSPSARRASSRACSRQFRTRSSKRSSQTTSARRVGGRQR